MRFELNFNNKQVSYGIDKVNGVFIQVQNEEGIFNWSEFYPFQQRLTYSSKFDIKRLLSREEYEQLIESSLVDESSLTGNWKVNFLGVYGSSKQKDMEEFWEQLLIDLMK